jgi:hypothetical protein
MAIVAFVLAMMMQQPQELRFGAQCAEYDGNRKVAGRLCGEWARKFTTTLVR